MGHRHLSGRVHQAVSSLPCVYVCGAGEGGGVVLVLSSWSLRVALGGPLLMPPLTIDTHMMHTIAGIQAQVRPLGPRSHV